MGIKKNLTFVKILLVTFLGLSSLVYADSNGILLDEFDSESAWKVFNNCNIELDSSNKVSGSSSLKISSTIENGGGVMNVEQVSTGKIDLTNLKNIEINLYTNDLQSYDTIALFVMTDNGNYYYNYIGSWEMMKGWNKIRRSVGAFKKFGKPSLDNITKMWIKVECKPEKKPVINVDKISYNLEGETNIMFTFDDALSGVYKYAYPILNKYGMKGTTWANKELSTGENPEFMSPDLLKILYDNGWDIGNHTVNHFDDITSLSTEQKISEYVENMEWLNSLGFFRSSVHACYPMGGFDDELLSILPQIGIKSGRSTIFGVQSNPVEDIYRIKCVAVGRDTNLDFVKSVINEAYMTGSNVFFMFHDLAKKPDFKNKDHEIVISENNFKIIVDYVSKLNKEGKVNVNTVSSWYNTYVSQEKITDVEPITNVEAQKKVKDTKKTKSAKKTKASKKTRR
jgi:peptidoglycan/xylan/chitin deacetylase (PgdA/CDA1 family)